MYVLDVLEGFYSDIQNISRHAPNSAAYLIALLQAIEQDQDLLDRLTQDHFENYDEPEFDVTTWERALRRDGLSLWRLKPHNRAYDYRIIYTYDGRNGEDIYYILGVMHRSEDYETDTDFARRIYDAYNDLDLPRFR